MHVYFHYINIVAFAFSVYCYLIILSRGERRLPMTFLFLSNFILIISSFFYWLLSSGHFFDYPHFLRVPAPFHYLIGPSIYLFVRTLLKREKSLQKWDWLHFLPFVLHVIELIPFYIQDASVKIEMIKVFQSNYASSFSNFDDGFLSSKVHTLIKFISWSTYIYFSARIYYQFKRTFKSTVITDYNRKISFIGFYLFTKYIGIIGIVTAIFFVKLNASLIVFTLLANIVAFSNIFLLAFKYPDLLYGEKAFSSVENNRENLMKILKSQNENLQFLENSKYEGNVLLDLNYRVIYSNKLGEEYFRRIYNYSLQLNDVVTDFLDASTSENLKKYISLAIEGKPVQIEQRFFLFGDKKFTWLQLNFQAHHAPNGNIVGVSIGVNVIDTKKKMESIQKQYQDSLDEIAWSSSHLLRAPVSNMMGILQVLKDSNFVISEEEKTYLMSNLTSELDKLDAVIKEMVAKARKDIDN